MLKKDDKASYYDAGGISTFDVLEAKLTEEQFKGFLIGNVMKYLCRYNHKNENSKRDLEKAQFYLTRLIEEVL